MNRRAFLKTLGACSAFAAIGGNALVSAKQRPKEASQAEQRPNVILILCDDLGWGDVAAFNKSVGIKSRMMTPHLDRAIGEGMRLDNHCTTAPVCAPARASLVTGQSQGHCNMRDNTFDAAIDPRMTLGTVMNRAGYATWHIGKWGIGGGYQYGSKRTAMACQSGYDYSYGYPAHLHGHSYYHCYVKGVTDIDSATKQSPVLESYSESAYEAAGAPKGFERDCQKGAASAQWRKVVPNEEVRFVYDTDLFTAKAKQLIADHRKGKAPNQPFFLHLCYTTVHGSGNRLVADPDIHCKQVFQVPGGPYPALSDTQPLGGGAVLGAAGIKGTPDKANTWIHPAFGSLETQSLRRYATSVRRLDDAVNDLIHFLRVSGLEENTMLVFTSDNGPAGEYLQPSGIKWVEEGFDSNGPFRGMKRWSFEGGLREPTFVRWPGHVPAGSVSAFPCSHTCWMPTFAQLAGMPPPAHSDGVSLLPTLLGRGRQLPCRLYTEYVDGGSGQGFGFEQSVRDGDWVMVMNRNTPRPGGKSKKKSPVGRPLLYNVVKDPGQTTDLSQQYPEVAARLKDLLLTCRIPCERTPEAYGAPSFACNTVPGRKEVDAMALPGLHASLPDPKAGVWLYHGDRWPWVPDFRALRPVAAPKRAPSALAPGGGLMVCGCLTLEKETEVTFAAKGQGGCHLWIHEAHILGYEAGACANGRTYRVKLAAGRHPWRACLTAPMVALTANGKSLL